MRMTPVLRCLSRLKLSTIATFVFATAASVSAQVSFLKVADTATSIPGGSGAFTDFRPAVSGKDVGIFNGKGSSGQVGFYKFDGTTLTKLVDTGTAAPGGTGNFTNYSFFAYGVDTTNFSFHGTDAGGMAGLYLLSGATPTLIANTNTAAPVSGVKFAAFGQPAVHNGKVAFFGFGPGSLYGGAFLYSAGTLTRLFDTNTVTFPGGAGTLAFSSQLAHENDAIAFWAFDSGLNQREGIFSFSNNVLSLLAVTNQTIPGFANTFSGFQSPPRLSGGTVVFLGHDLISTPAVRGIFAVPAGGGAITTLVSTATAIPGGTNGLFTSFSGFAYENGVLIFTGSGTNFITSIYKLQGGVLELLVDKNALLDGKAVSSFSLNTGSLNQGLFTFQASFTDSSKGIFGAAISVPQDAILGINAYSPGTGLTLSFTGENNRGYRIQYSSTLLPASWTDLTNFTYSSPLTVPDASAAGLSRRFYRAISP